jgi:hypothetical protein
MGAAVWAGVIGGAGYLLGTWAEAMLAAWPADARGSVWLALGAAGLAVLVLLHWGTRALRTAAAPAPTLGRRNAS